MRRRRDEVSCASSPFSLVKDASRSAQPTKFEALAVTIRWSSLESIGSHCGRTLWAIPLRAHGILQAGRSRPRYASGATGIGKLENGSRPEAISEIARLRRSLPEPGPENRAALSIRSARPPIITVIGASPCRRRINARSPAGGNGTVEKPAAGEPLTASGFRWRSLRKPTLPQTGLRKWPLRGSLNLVVRYL